MSYIADGGVHIQENSRVSGYLGSKRYGSVAEGLNLDQSAIMIDNIDVNASFDRNN